MSYMNLYVLLAVAFSSLITASPFVDRAIAATTTSAAPPTTTTPPNNLSPGTVTAGCTEFFTVPSNTICWEIETQFDITDTLFRQFNPQVNAACTNLIAGEAYCVGTNNSTPGVPGNVEPGTVTDGCTAFHTIVTGDICLTIDAQFNITLAEFLTLNPEVDAQCGNLVLGRAYCVQSTAIPGSS